MLSQTAVMKLIAFLLATALVGVVSARAASPVHDIKINTLDGQPTSLGEYKGKVILLVNVASKCGLTPQYDALQALQEKFSAKGFTVIGVPCNDFGAQEPGTSEEIQKFCKDNYKVSFPLMQKVSVKGDHRHPLYARLTGAGAEFPGDIAWNFGKFLIGRDGQVLARFEPKIKPDATDVVAAIEAALAAK
jgi:glutathione peroxidase